MQSHVHAQPQARTRVVFAFRFCGVHRASFSGVTPSRARIAKRGSYVSIKKAVTASGMGISVPIIYTTGRVALVSPCRAHRLVPPAPVPL